MTFKSPSAIQILLAKRVGLPPTASKDEICRVAMAKLAAMGPRMSPKTKVFQVICWDATGRQDQSAGNYFGGPGEAKQYARDYVKQTKGSANVRSYNESPDLPGQRLDMQDVASYEA